MGAPPHCSAETVWAKAVAPASARTETPRTCLAFMMKSPEGLDVQSRTSRPSQGVTVTIPGLGGCAFWHLVSQSARCRWEARHGAPTFHSRPAAHRAAARPVGRTAGAAGRALPMEEPAGRDTGAAAFRAEERGLLRGLGRPARDLLR